MAENETKNIDENQTKFKKLVEIAEEYIENNALKVLNAKRKSENEKYKEAKNCYELISSKYKPMYTINNNENVKPADYLLANEDSKYYEKDATTLEEKLLVRFCIQLQNYQAMPKAINYASFSKNKDNNTDDINSSNDIFKIAQKYLNNKNDKNNKVNYIDLYLDFRKSDKDKKKFEETFRKFTLGNENDIKIKDIKQQNNKYKFNYAWMKYSKGLADAINFLNDKSAFDELKKLIKKVYNFSILKNEYTIKMLKNDLKTEFYERKEQKISYMAETLSYDFFKEIGCRNLLKDDVHIVAIYKKVFNENDNKTKIVEKMLNWCEQYKKANPNKDTYYIDKILWLCCTGAFYEDDIIITTMNRKNFFDYYDAKTKNKK